MSSKILLASLVLLGAISPALAQEADLILLDFTFSPQSLDPGGHPTKVTYDFGNFGPDDIDADSVVSEMFLSRNAIFGDSDDVRIWQSEQFFGFFPAGSHLPVTLSPA